MIFEQQDCSGGKRLYVKHPDHPRDIFRLARLSEEQICCIKDYLDGCDTAKLVPSDVHIIALLAERQLPVTFS